ncbi:hypothetical protein Zmor_012629 [Zophobas morio]|uniref:Uncharacterized protein n=1 Tax=Zophobas morio TaxID=2755281 RepID=A0AA38MDW6_9CUCU|nr:hypothetical protein Zmor_012629 [Zophobas morio]
MTWQLHGDIEWKGGAGRRTACGNRNFPARQTIRIPNGVDPLPDSWNEFFNQRLIIHSWVADGQRVMRRILTMREFGLLRPLLMDGTRQKRGRNAEVFATATSNYFCCCF